MDIQDVTKLAELISEHDLSEISYEGEDCKLKLKRARGVETVVTHQAAVPLASAPAPVAEKEIAAPAVESLPTITSPIVGTFYTSPAPDAAPFVLPGDVVGVDTVVCIVEAMKVMNEIKAEMAGTIKRVLVENGTPVEYGQPLFEIEPA